MKINGKLYRSVVGKTSFVGKQPMLAHRIDRKTRGKMESLLRIPKMNGWDLYGKYLINDSHNP